MKKKTRTGLLILAGLILLLPFYYQTVLQGAAAFLAPSENGKAEVAILEGTQVLRKKALTQGMTLLSAGRARKLVVVLHQTPPDEELVALPSDYPQLVKKELKQMGLRSDQFLVILSPILHPITSSEAKFVLKTLSQFKVRSAILISEGFHTRRSFGVYQSEGNKLGLRITPHPYYSSYQKEHWWLQTEGVRAFVTEYLKLGYYLLRGYLPLKTLFST